MQASNWLIGLLLLSVMAIKVLWGADLCIVAHMTPRRPRWRVLMDGTLWLGWYFITSGVFVYGVLGFFLLRSPHQTVPLWFAVPAAVFTIDCILAWYFLGPGSPPTDREGESS